MPRFLQPMVCVHPKTKRKSLYISPIYNDKIEGMEEVESVDLISELTAFAGQDKFVYKHKWETDDILMWDNRCTMHAVLPYDSVNHRRIMHRTTLVGDSVPKA